MLYQDPKRWSFSFNMYAQLTRVQMHTKKTVRILLFETLGQCTSCKTCIILCFENSYNTLKFELLTISCYCTTGTLIYLKCIQFSVCFICGINPFIMILWFPEVACQDHQSVLYMPLGPWSTFTTLRPEKCNLGMLLNLFTFQMICVWSI